MQVQSTGCKKMDKLLMFSAAVKALKREIIKEKFIIKGCIEYFGIPSPNCHLLG